MKQAAICTGVLLLIVAESRGQTPPDRAVLEVASVKAAPGGEGRRRESLRVTPDSVTMSGMTLKSCIQWAYHVMDYQVTAPDWAGVERYDIAAKSAKPANEEQLRAMMQGLLADRFKLVLHKQTRELPAYVLTVGKNGPKFRESATEGESVIEPDRKTFTVTVQRTGVSQLVTMLSNFLRAPVIDQTGLTGKYDMTLNLAKYVDSMRVAGGDGNAPADPLWLITAVSRRSSASNWSRAKCRSTC